MQELKSMEDLESLISSQQPSASVEPEVQQPVHVEQPVAETEVQQSIAVEQPVAETEVQQSIAVEQPIVSPRDAKITHRNNLLNLVKIDLKNIKIVKSDNPLGTFQEVENLFLAPTFPVIALQSGYRAEFSALSNNDMILARKFNGTVKEQNLKLLNLVYNKMAATNLGKIKFENWMKLTAEADLHTLVYGVYCATFPQESNYDIACPKCGVNNTTKVSKEVLITARNEQRAVEYIQAVLDKYSPQELGKHSALNFTDRIILEDSKIIIDLFIPSLWDYIGSLSRAESYAKRYEPELFGFLKHVSGMFIPSLHALERGSVEYVELEGLDDRLNVLNKLSKADRETLLDAIIKKNSDLEVTYKIPDIMCKDCGHVITNIQMDMVELLFQNIVLA